MNTTDYEKGVEYMKKFLKVLKEVGIALAAFLCVIGALAYLFIIKIPIADEIPQAAQGKTIMTMEPKFIPSNAVINNYRFRKLWFRVKIYIW